MKRHKNIFLILIAVSLAFYLAAILGLLGYGVVAGLAAGFVTGAVAFLWGGFFLTQKTILRSTERLLFSIGLIAIGGCIWSVGLYFFKEQTFYSVIIYQGFVALYLATADRA